MIMQHRGGREKKRKKEKKNDTWHSERMISQFWSEVALPIIASPLEITPPDELYGTAGITLLQFALCCQLLHRHHMFFSF